MSFYPLVSVRDIAKIHYGKALKAENRVESGAIPVFGSSGQIGFHNKNLVDYPTLIVGRKGSVGEVTYAINGGWPIDTVFYTELIKPDKVDLRFFYYALKRSHLDRWTITTSIPGLNRDDLYATEIPLPPLEEQRRIAAILDKADAVRRKRKEAIALTEELLRSAFLDMFGDPVTNPKGWDVLPMHEVIQTIEAGWSANGEDRRCESDEWGVLKISAVTSGRFQVNEHKVVEEILPNKSLIIPSKGDLLFSRANTRELVAATCLVDKNCERLFLPDKLWRIKPKPKFANTEYLKFLLSNPKYRSLIARKATGTSGSMLNVSQAKLLEMYAPIPDLQKQRCFAEVVWQIFGMREQHELTTIESNSMFNSLLQRAFRGEL